MPLKVYDGSKWVIAANVKVWNGTSWASANGSVWDGSSWAQYHPCVYLPSNYGLYAVAISFGFGAQCESRIQTFANSHIQGITTSTNYGTTIQNDDIWKLNGDLSDYDVMITDLVVGGITTSGSMSENVPYPISTDPYFAITAYVGADSTANFNLKILANNTGTVLATSYVDMSATAVDAGS